MQGEGMKKSLRYEDLVAHNYYVIAKMNELGITNQYTGFYFLVDILDQLINESKVVRSFSREVYPMLAKKYDKNDCTIERDIRNIINVLWDYRLKNKLVMFWSREEKPSCCEFIYIIKNYLVMDIA